MKKTSLSAVISTFILCFVFYMLFTFAFTLEEILVGAIVSLIVAVFTAKFFIHDNPFYLFNPSRLGSLLRYVFFIFPKELLKANIDVAKRALNPSLPVKPGIVKVPSDLKSEYALSMLANSITLTPGTITMDIAEEDGKNYYYIHWIDVATTNPEKAGETIKGTLEKGIGDMEVIEFIYAGIFYILLSIVLIYRVAKGPYVVDRAVASDSIDIMTSVALILFSLYSGRGIYLDIALIIALLGFIGTVLISRYLEGRL